MFYTYLHYRNDTGQVFYVGKGCGRRSHSKSSRGRHWHAIAAKHGYTIEIAARWITEAEAFEHECFLIETLPMIGVELINRTAGGEGATGHRHDAATREVMSAAIRRAYERPGVLERRAEINRATHKNPATKAAMSSAQARVWADPVMGAARLKAIADAATRPDVKARRSVAQSLAQNRPEVILKQRLARLKNTNGAGKPKKPVICLNTGDYFESTTDAGAYFGIRYQNVSRVARGERAHANGLMFAFASTESIFH